MRIGFCVNDVATEKGDYTTTRLAQAAHARGWEVWYVGVDGFAMSPDGRVIARATRVPSGTFEEPERYLEALQGEDAEHRRIDAGALDAMMLRNNPADEIGARPWAQTSGILFGHALQQRGVVVLNDPRGLALAFNKMYLERFPKEVRPETLITRDRDELRGFVHAHEGGTILKPVQGSGGESVFLVAGPDARNVNQMVDAVLRDGYVIAQEYLPDASERDTRLLLVDGEPLVCSGRYCAVTRVGAEDDIRTNISAGGTIADAVVDDRVLELAALVRDGLVEDGMFFVGLDIAGGKIMEINVFTPGGLEMAENRQSVDFAGPVLDALERRVRQGTGSARVAAPGGG